LRPEQESSIHAILEGCDTLAVMPTGSGKSAMYQIAGVMLPGPTVVVSPLIALDQDQVEKLDELDLPSSPINSNMEFVGRRETFQRLAERKRKPWSNCELRGRLSSWSTRRIASASGATTSGKITTGWGCAIRTFWCSALTDQTSGSVSSRSMRNASSANSYSSGSARLPNRALSTLRRAGTPRIWRQSWRAKAFVPRHITRD